MAASNEESTMIRIYPSFTEIRDNIKVNAEHKIYFSQDLYNQIMPGSLNLENVNVKAMNAVLRENNLEGKTVHVKKDDKIRQVKMIRSRDALVQDLETNRYYHVNKNDIEYSEIPEETGNEITFNLEKEGSAVMSYLMHGISWKPRYSFNIEGDNNVFQGWADITNNTMKMYLVDKTELFGGDVSINQHRPHRGMMMMARSNVAMDFAPKIQAEGELAGLYFYSISNGYRLDPRSTFSLPFVAPKIELKKIAYLSSHFSPNNSKGQSGRVYRIKSSEFLPSGSVTVREDGRVVGQDNIPDLPVDESHDIRVGNDSEVSFERNVKTLVHNENISQYEVQIAIKNKKSRDVNYEFKDSFNGRFEIDVKSENAQIENNEVSSKGLIGKKSEIILSYLVKFFYK